jgi:hypothetical protein
MKTLLSAVLFLSAVSLQAAEVTLRFTDAKERSVWVLDQMPDRMPAAGRSFNSKTIPVQVTGDSQVVVVHDPSTDSVAIKSAGDIEGTWTIAEKDWRAAKVTVEAFTRGVPLESGTAELNSPSFTKSMPIENGKATFFGVPFGEIQVSVDHNGSGIPPTAPQIFRISKEMEADERVVGVTVVADPSAETGPAQPTEQSAPKSTGGPWYVNALLWLGGLALAVVGFLFLMKLLKERSDVVEEKLKGFGVPVPSDLGSPPPQDDGPAAQPFEPPPVVSVGHCQYCGKPQADCICRLDAPRAVAPSGEPEFVGAGVELRIPEGESVLGREGDLQIVDPTVSRRHAKVTREANIVRIEDLGSANGTYVDGAKIEEETEVKPGSTVYFGSVKVRLEA